MLKLSIVIVTYNSGRFIAACLDSVFAQESCDFEVIVVDNGSSDETRHIIQRYPHIKFIANAINRGACYGRNQGIAASQGEWILVLDSDAVLEKNFSHAFLDTAARLDARVGSLQPLILFPDGKTVYSCGLHLSVMRRFFDLRKGAKVTPYTGPDKDIFGACSACALYRRSMLEAIREKEGYFDERFFFLVEDVDLAWRAQKSGWKTVFLPAAACRHHGKSSAHDAAMRQYLCLRNRFYMILKNEGTFLYCKRIWPLLLYDIPRIVFLFFKNTFVRKDILRRLSCFVGIKKRCYF